MSHSIWLFHELLVIEIVLWLAKVMKAINNNSYTQLQTAVNAAPRGERFNWVLIVKAWQVWL